MAIPAQNLVFTWGSTTLQEIRELDIRVSFETDTGKAGRNAGPQYYISGEMTLTGFSAVGLEQDGLLSWQSMTITAPISASQRRVIWSGYAQYFASNIAASTNGVVSFAFQFRLYGALPSIGSIVSI